VFVVLLLHTDCCIIVFHTPISVSYAFDVTSHVVNWSAAEVTQTATLALYGRPNTVLNIKYCTTTGCHEVLYTHPTASIIQACIRKTGLWVWFHFAFIVPASSKCSCRQKFWRHPVRNSASYWT
jgi:hypothetical protein